MDGFLSLVEKVKCLLKIASLFCLFQNNSLRLLLSFKFSQQILKINEYWKLIGQKYFVASSDISCAKLIGTTLIVLGIDIGLLLKNQTR